MLCLEITVEGYTKLAQPDSCQYVLLTLQEHTKLTDISNWFQFDISDVSLAFGSGIIIWALGLKLGAIARVIVGAKRG
ncbi:hypothetical protein [Aeromonas sp. BIGb0445]|jgi:hypothetical protein|uniref:hypothetical protein n=1 Tax=Aeromonas TaxID=642 RepID=UPI0021670C55|nr:hypothetical protein [Aeromonas sp. BIGb0445]MCS3459126.1 hypothetical protein [Aeromonas sp. BIGb0445]